MSAVCDEMEANGRQLGSRGITMEAVQLHTQFVLYGI